jgi:hypothetical protein
MLKCSIHVHTEFYQNQLFLNILYGRGSATPQKFHYEHLPLYRRECVMQAIPTRNRYVIYYCLSRYDALAYSGINLIARQSESCCICDSTPGSCSPLFYLSETYLERAVKP